MRQFVHEHDRIRQPPFRHVIDHEIPQDGPLLIAGLIGMIMWTWVKGTAILSVHDRQSEIPLSDLLGMLDRRPPPTFVPGTAIYLTAHPDFAPVALMHTLKHFKSLHEQNIILTIVTADVPRIAPTDRIRMETINPRFRRIVMTFGYMEEPNVPHELGLYQAPDWHFEIMTTSFIVSRRSLKLAARSAMPTWQGRLFIFLARNAADASAYFQIPAGRVVEIGTQVNV